MTVSSRTPEGNPIYCPICGHLSNVEPSFPGNDGCCPRCGQLLWWFQDKLSQTLGVPFESIQHEISFVNDLGADSLDMVELVMELEEEFDLEVPEEDLKSLRTIGDVIRYIQKRHRENEESE